MVGIIVSRYLATLLRWTLPDLSMSQLRRSQFEAHISEEIHPS